jgi:hypothetical protein
MRFEFRYDGLSTFMLKVLGHGPKHSYIEVLDQSLSVRLGWGFRATVPRASIRTAELTTARPISRGAHGWNGRWLVNGSGRGLVVIAIDPKARGYCVGFPVNVRQLTLSLESPTELIQALTVG